MVYCQPLRTIIAKENSELIIYGADNFPQYPRRTASVKSKCDRALAAACRRDIVVLRGRLNREYNQWLRSVGLGTDLVIEYMQPAVGATLSELIIENPDPIKEMVRRLGRKPVYAPWFSAQHEALAAAAIGAELFGATKSETLKYNDKHAFKELCQKLSIPVVNSSTLRIQHSDNNNFQNFEKLVSHHLLSYNNVLIRGTLGVSGTSLYKTQGSNLLALYKCIVDSGEEYILIEPFLEVTSSPNDQWVVNGAGEMTHIGLFDQNCRQGMIHIGNTKGLPIATETCRTISEASSQIVKHMSESGYCGVVGIDYIVTSKGVFPVENNARFNGSTYVNLLVHNIEANLGAIPIWKFKKFYTRICSFAALTNRMTSLLYNGKRKNSIVLLNCDELEETGEVAIVLLAQDIAQFSSLEKEWEALDLE